jgi:hypothetical protein
MKFDDTARVNSEAMLCWGRANVAAIGLRHP